MYNMYVSDIQILFPSLMHLKQHLKYRNQDMWFFKIFFHALKNWILNTESKINESTKIIGICKMGFSNKTCQVHKITAVRKSKTCVVFVVLNSVFLKLNGKLEY